VALEKARALSEAGAQVVVVAPKIVPELVALVAEHDARPFRPRDLDDVWLAIAAATPAVNRAVRAAADERHRFVVAVDDVASCSAFGLARIKRGDLVIGIGTGGRAPALAAIVRRALERILPPDLGAWVDAAERERAAWKRDGVPLAERRERLVAQLAELARESGS
jgi:siroheme synthase-like protein